MGPQAAWQATLNELELQMTRATFNTWLKDAHLLSCDDDCYVVGVQNAYAKDWLEHRLHDTIFRTLTAVSDSAAGLRFVVAAAVASDSFAANGQQPGSASVKQKKKGKGKVQMEMQPEVEGVVPTTRKSLIDNGRLTDRFTFETFVVGTSNRLAHAAALSVAENPGQTYNPLFIYGGVGLGKTHLLHAIGNQCRAQGREVCYISSETFTNDLVQSIRNKTMAEFRARYRTPDVLLIDDIQFIAGKESTQEELFHTFNALHSQGKQVVISSDRPPKAMVTLEERLQSRFEWGLMADIQIPDIETRQAILQTKAEESGLYVSRDVIEFIAQHVRNNIRELEGALNKIIAYAQLSGGAIDDDIINMALADLGRQPERMTIEQIITAVCDHYQVTHEQIASRSRSRAIAFPRQMAMYLARTETDASLPQIGEKLGGRDHTTILYGYEKIASLAETDTEIRRSVMEIKSALYESNLPA
jgi:chromosomal replication initiator protein